MECSNPFFIVNPTIVRQQLVSKGYTLVDTPFKQFHTDCAFFPKHFFNPRTFGVTLKNSSRYNLVNPFTGDSVPLFIPVPCGKCDCCTINKAEQLRNRMVLEGVGRTYLPIFITLTYNNENLPRWGVRKSHIQLFMKRLRFYISKEYKFKIKYCICSEYGDEKGRPHYHGILYGIDVPIWDLFKKIFPLIERAWTYGFSYSKPCNRNGLRYVSKYVYKKTVVPEGLAPNFVLTSRMDGGFGSYCLRDYDFVKRAYASTGVVEVLSFGEIVKVKIPPFILNKLYSTPEKLYGVWPMRFYDRLCQVFQILNFYSDAYPACSFDLNDDHPSELPPEILRTFFFRPNPYDFDLPVCDSLRDYYPYRDYSLYIREYISLLKILKSYKLDITLAMFLESRRQEFQLRRMRYLSSHKRDSSTDSYESQRIINSYRYKSKESKDGQ